VAPVQIGLHYTPGNEVYCSGQPEFTLYKDFIVTTKIHEDVGDAELNMYGMSAA